MYLAGYPGEVGSGGLPQSVLKSPRRGGDSEIEKIAPILLFHVL